MDRTIYIVHGTTGEWSDRGEWAVRAFTDEAKAKDFVERCDKIAAAWFVKNEQRYWDVKDAHELDPNFSCDYTGTHYFLRACPLEGK